MRTRVAGIAIAAGIAAGTLFFMRGPGAEDPPPYIAVDTAIAMDTAGAAVDALSADAADPTGVAWVCAQHPERVRMLFAGLDLERPGLAAVRERVDAGAWVDACAELLQYYREGDSGSWLRLEKPPYRPGRYERADKALADTIYVSYVYQKMPRREDGGVDWTFSGPIGAPNYHALFNGLIHVSHLIDGYRASGDAKYARRIDADVRDWILANPYPGPTADGIPWGGLRVATRVHCFSDVFYGLMAEPEVTDATRLLILTSLVEHADLLRYNNSDFGNRLIREMNGLARAGVSWPELHPSGEWIDFATGIMRRELDRQVYPDGVQYELSSHYHTIVARLYEEFLELLDHAGRDASDMRSVVEKMWDYVAYTMRPDGLGVVNNDSYENFNRPRVLEMAPIYGREDWVYIATHGKRGSIPDWEPSLFYPWAGQVVMRSDWGADALWAYFEFGPAGKAHYHWDRLHISVSAFGRDLLVDNGLYYYANDPWCDYFRGTTAHNVILVDGKGQKLWDKTTRTELDPSHWRPGRETEVARGSMDAFDGVRGRAVHHRAVTHVRGEYWLVVDRIETDRPRDLTAMWHFHPDCTVTLDGTDAMSVDPGKGNLRIVPVGTVDWMASRVRATKPPEEIQGWYSPKPNNKLPATVAVYTGRIEETTTFAWVLYPTRGLPQKPAARLLEDGRIAIRTGTGAHVLPTGLD